MGPAISRVTHQVPGTANRQAQKRVGPAINRATRLQNPAPQVIYQNRNTDPVFGRKRVGLTYQSQNTAHPNQADPGIYLDRITGPLNLVGQVTNQGIGHLRPDIRIPVSSQVIRRHSRSPDIGLGVDRTRIGPGLNLGMEIGRSLMNQVSICINTNKYLRVFFFCRHRSI